MIIDIHSHILPGIDDGSADIQETIEMLNMAVQEKITGIIATPHFEVGMDKDWLLHYRNAYIKTAEYIQSNNLPINIYVGNEIFYSESVLELLKTSEVATLNDSKYVLVEFPVYADFGYIRRAVCNIQYAGFWPIIAHVERYNSLSKIDRIEELVNIGAYIQLNASTVMGKLGFNLKHFSVKLIKKGLVHFLATDSHGSKKRRPKIQEALNYLEKKIGSKQCRIISEINPHKVLKGERISE